MFETPLEKAINSSADLVPRIRREEATEIAQIQSVIKEIELILNKVLSSAADNKNNFSSTVLGDPTTKLATLISAMTNAIRGFRHMSKTFQRIKTEKGYFEKMGALAGGMVSSLETINNNLKTNQYTSQDKFLRDFQNLINVYIGQIKTNAGLEINQIIALMKNN